MPPRAAFDENGVPLDKGGTSGGFWAVTDNLVRAVDPETHPGASRHPGSCETILPGEGTGPPQRS